MPNTSDSAQYVEPFTHDGTGTKALHFSIGDTQSRIQIQDPDALDLEYRRVMKGLVLITPHVIALRDKFLVPADGERFSVVQNDGARFVRHCAGLNPMGSWW